MHVARLLHLLLPLFLLLLLLLLLPQLLFQRETPYSSPWHADPRAISDILGLNLFRMLFEVELSEEELAGLYEYDGLLAPAVLGLGVSAANGARMAELRAPIEARVFNSEIGKRFLVKAAESGLSGGAASRLKEIVFIAMFAGYGGTGTLCRYTVQHILKDTPANVALYKQDPSAFVLEAARLYPSVAGMNPFVFTDAVTVTLGTGRKLSRAVGDLGLIHSTGANLDPAIFGSAASGDGASSEWEESDAAAFRPGRANADRLLTWNNELRAIRSCPTGTTMIPYCTTALLHYCTAALLHSCAL